MSKTNPPDVSPASAEGDRPLHALVLADQAGTPGEAAQHLAHAGLRILPLIPGTKMPLTPHGHLDATSDLAQVQSWWGRFPEANIGLATGTGSFDVLDVDVRPGGSGIDLVEGLIERAVLPQPGLTVRTPSGGLHLYYRGTVQRNSRLPQQFVDLKASGGYVVAAPSRISTRGTSTRYEVEHVGATLDVLPWHALRPAAGALPGKGRFEQMAKQGGQPATLAALEGFVLAGRAGERNDRLFWALCRAVAGGLNVDPLCRAARHVGLSRTEVEKTLRSAHRKVTGQ